MLMVNERYRITRTDAYNITIEKLVEVKKKSGEVIDEWQTLGYYSKMEHALNFIKNDYLCDGVGTNEEKITLSQFIDEIKTSEVVVKLVEVK